MLSSQRWVYTLYRWNLQKIMIEIENYCSLSFCIIFNLCFGQMYDKLVWVFCSMPSANWVYIWAEPLKVPFHALTHGGIISELTWWFKRYSIQNGIMHLTVHKWYHICMGIVGRLLFFCLFRCERHAHTELPPPSLSLSMCTLWVWSDLLKKR